MSDHGNLPYTDPWTVLGVHRGASRDEVKAAFRRAALVCHPDVDKSPQAAARFTQVKLAADVLLKGHAAQPGARSGWNVAAAAAATGQAAPAAGVPRNRTAALWAGLLVACGLAFGYGYSWQAYVARKAAYSTPEEAKKRLRNPSPQRRKLLQVLVADERQPTKHGQQAQRGAAAAPAAAAPAAAAGGGGGGAG